MSVFNDIILRYGPFILIRVRELLEKEERYEECAEINSVLKNYDIPIDTTIEDWKSYLWEKGYIGDIATYNIEEYFNKAILMINKKR